MKEVDEETVGIIIELPDCCWYELPVSWYELPVSMNYRLVSMELPISMNYRLVNIELPVGWYGITG